MAHHKSAKKRIRQAESRRVSNRYQSVTMRNALKKIRGTENKEEAEKLLPNIVSMLDKLSKSNLIHKNKASNLKSGLQVLVNNLK